MSYFLISFKQIIRPSHLYLTTLKCSLVSPFIRYTSKHYTFSFLNFLILDTLISPFQSVRSSNFYIPFLTLFYLSSKLNKAKCEYPFIFFHCFLFFVLLPFPFSNFCWSYTNFSLDSYKSTNRYIRPLIFCLPIWLVLSFNLEFLSTNVHLL